MKIVVDLDVCDAHGECVAEAPELFELGDDSAQVTLLHDEVEDGSDLADAAQRGADSCPVAAISLED